MKGHQDHRGHGDRRGYRGHRSREANVALLVARLCLATVFVSSALDKFRPPPKELEQIGELHLPASPETLSTLAGTCEMIGAASLVTGVGIRASAVLLSGFLAAISFKELNFWAKKGPPEAIASQRDAFVANVAIVGGLIYAAIKGPGRLAFGRRRWGRHGSQRG